MLDTGEHGCCTPFNGDGSSVFYAGVRGPACTRWRVRSHPWGTEGTRAPMLVISGCTIGQSERARIPYMLSFARTMVVPRARSLRVPPLPTGGIANQRTRYRDKEGTWDDASFDDSIDDANVSDTRLVGEFVAAVAILLVSVGSALAPSLAAYGDGAPSRS